MALAPGVSSIGAARRERRRTVSVIWPAGGRRRGRGQSRKAALAQRAEADDRCGRALDRPEPACATRQCPAKSPQRRRRSPNEPSQPTQPTDSPGSGVARAGAGRLRHLRSVRVQQSAAGAGTRRSALPPAFPPQDIVGRWGLAAYHKDEDRARIEVAAANQCKQPYVITLGPTGGVMMHLADQAKRRRAAPERRAGQQDLYRPGRRAARRRAGPRSGVVRRPRADPALDGFGSAGPLRHHGLCALRRRRAPSAPAKPKAKRPQAEAAPIRQPPISSAADGSAAVDAAAVDGLPRSDDGAGAC